MSSSNPPTYAHSHLPLLASWTSYKDSTLSLLPSIQEQDLEIFRNLVLQSQNADALPDNREAARRLVEEFKKHRRKELEDLVVKIDEMAEQVLSALEKAEIEIVSLRSDRIQAVQAFRPSYDSYPNRRTVRRQADGAHASVTEEGEKGYEEERAMKRAAAQERWEMGERQSKEERDRRRKERDRRREERRRGEDGKRLEELGKGDESKEATQKTGGGENEAGEDDRTKGEK